MSRDMCQRIVNGCELRIADAIMSGDIAYARRIATDLAAVRDDMLTSAELIAAATA